MFVLAATIAAFAIFAILALRHGAESRPFFDERPERGCDRIR